MKKWYGPGQLSFFDDLAVKVEAPDATTARIPTALENANPEPDPEATSNLRSKENPEEARETSSPSWTWLRPDCHTRAQERTGLNENTRTAAGIFVAEVHLLYLPITGL